MSSFYGCAGGSSSGGGSGTPGVGIKNAQINESGELVLTYTNNVEQNVGPVVGADGENGVNGATFIPKIENNILTWENDGDLPNPAPVDFNTVEDQTQWDGIGVEVEPIQTRANSASEDYKWEEI